MTQDIISLSRFVAYPCICVPHASASRAMCIVCCRIIHRTRYARTDGDGRRRPHPRSAREKAGGPPVQYCTGIGVQYTTTMDTNELRITGSRQQDGRKSKTKSRRTTSEAAAQNELLPQAGVPGWAYVDPNRVRFQHSRIRPL